MKSRRRTIWCRDALLRATVAAALAVVVSGALPSASAQQGVTSASLSGQTEDANGAAVGGALVTARNLETSLIQTATSDAAGRYRFARLPVGAYRLTVESRGPSPPRPRQAPSPVPTARVP